MQEALPALPELGSVLQTFATAQQQFGDLQHRLQEQADESLRKDEALKATLTELAALRVEYEQEKASGREIRDGLSKRYIDLRTKESAVQAGGNALEQERAALRKKAETFENDRSELQKREAAVDNGLKDLKSQETAFHERAKTFDKRLRELNTKEATVKLQDQDIKARTVITEGLELDLNQRETNITAWHRELVQAQDARDADLWAMDADLRAREARLEGGNGYIQKRMNEFTNRFEIIVQENNTKANALQALLAQTIQEKEELQTDLASQKNACDHLSTAYETLRRELSAVGGHAKSTAWERDQAQTVIESLRKDLSSKTAELAQYENALRDVQQTLNTWNNTYLSKKTEIGQLHAQQAAKVNSTDSNSQLAETITQLRGEIISERERLEKHVRNLQAEIETSNRNRIADQEAPVAKQKQDLAEYDRLHAEYDRLHAEHDRLHAEHDQKVDKVRELKEQLRNAGQAAETCVTNLKATLKGVKLNNSELKQKLLQEQSQVKAKAAAVSRAQEATAGQVQRYCTLESLYNDLQKEHDELQKEYNALQKVPGRAPQSATLQDTRTIETLRIKNATFIQKNRNLTDQYQELEGKNRGLQETVRSLEEAGTSLRSTSSQQLRLSRNAVLRAQQELQSEIEKRKALEDATHICNKENAALRAKIKSYGELFAEHNEQLNVQRGELRDCNDENYDLRAELKSLKEHLQARDALINRVDRSLSPTHELPPHMLYARRRGTGRDADATEPSDDGTEAQNEDSEENEDSDDNISQSGSEQDAESSSESERVSPTEERALYNKFMKQRLSPKGHPAFETLQPIQKIGASPLSIIRHDLPRKRRNLHCPKRSLWCGAAGRHALVFAPTRELGFRFRLGL
ncbi:hypothetical protein C8F04DRAFT_1093744, partial [Mycena alexandri]